MSNKFLNGNLFKTLVANGCQSLINDIDRINDLNVFPVPDGDTGTNMKQCICRIFYCTIFIKQWNHLWSI